MERRVANEILSDMNNYPYYLFLSDVNSVSNEISKLPWSCILTTETNQDKLISLFQSDTRRCKFITTPEDFECEPIKKNQLTIVLLCGTKHIDELTKIEQIGIDKNISNYFEYIPTLLAHFGYIIFDTCELSTFIKIKIEELFFSLRNNSISIFNCPDNIPFSSELIDEKTITIYKQSLITFFSESDLSLYTDAEDDIDDVVESRIDFFINTKRVYRDKNKYQDFLDSFYLVTEQEINKVQVSSFLTSNYFYQFLQNSAYSHEWYGYINGFNYRRDEDEQFYEIVKNKLKTPNECNTFLIHGQSGCGKTVAINNIAYKIFKEREYPVIFLKNSQFDFFKNTDNYNYVMTDNINSNFLLLDEFIHDLENDGAKNVLLIWDLSLPLYRDYSNIYFKLSKFLHNRGRNFVLLCSGYSAIDNKNTKVVTQSELNILSPYSRENVQELISYFKKFADFSNTELQNISEFLISQKDNDLNIFYIFYRFFYIVKPVIIKGIRREAEFSIESVIKHCQKTSGAPDYTLMQLALIKAGIMKEDEVNNTYTVNNADIRQLLIITAICCKFNISVPSDLALRLLQKFDLELIKLVTNIPFFRFNYDDDGDYSFSLRSQLEANILLQALNVSKEDFIKYICNLIKNAELTSNNYKSNKEVKCIADLLHRMGPNSNNKSEFFDYYPLIISELKALHKKNKKIDIKIIVIEINYIREYFCNKDKNHEIAAQYFNNEMEYIINLGDSYSAVKENQKDFNYNMIKIEIANARYYMYYKNYSTDISTLYKAKRDAESVFSMYGDYSYNIWFKTCLELYKKQQSPELLMDMLNLIDILHFENENIESDVYMQDLFSQVYAILNNSTDIYIDNLILKGNSAGLYLKVLKVLNEYSINIDNIKELTPDIEKKLNKLLSDIFTQERQQIVISSLECLSLLIKLKWLLYNHASFSMGDKELTKMTQAQWTDISILCNQYLILKDSLNISKSSVVIEYLQALCFAQTEQYVKANQLLQDIKLNGQTYEISNRVYTRHILCDEHGKVKNFTGRISITKEGQCRINIAEFTNNRIPLHCKESNLKHITIEDGKVDNYFQIGIGIMGLNVYHGFRNGQN